MDATGNFVVTWSSNNQDGSGYGVYAQRYNAAGVAQGAEFRVSTTTAGSQITSQIAMSSTGAFVIVWSSPQDPDASIGIYGQRYDASGVAQGGEFRVNTYTAGTQQLASVAMSDSGSFVVTWASDLQDGSGYGVYGQRFAANGTAQGNEFRVNTTTANSQLYHDVTMLADGRFVVVYQSRNADGTFEVYLQRYAANGSAIGGETRVNTTTVSSAQQPIASVSADAGGNLTVVWNSAADGAGIGVVGRRFSWNGSAIGAEFQVNTTTAGDQLWPEVVAQPGGRFIVAWGGNGTRRRRRRVLPALRAGHHRGRHVGDVPGRPDQPADRRRDDHDRQRRRQRRHGQPDHADLHHRELERAADGDGVRAAGLRQRRRRRLHRGDRGGDERRRELQRRRRGGRVRHEPGDRRTSPRSTAFPRRSPSTRTARWCSRRATAT